jgi:hypothetical protein
MATASARHEAATLRFGAPATAQPPSASSAGGVQTPLPTSHNAPGAQSRDDAQRVPHSPVGRHRYGAHEVRAPSGATLLDPSSEHENRASVQTPSRQTFPCAQCSFLLHAVRQPASSQA